MKTDYYTDQLCNVPIDGKYPARFVLTCGDKKTNNIDLNRESAIALINFLTDNYLKLK